VNATMMDLGRLWNDYWQKHHADVMRDEGWSVFYSDDPHRAPHGFVINAVRHPSVNLVHFNSDETAELHVLMRAHEGSVLHQMAINLITRGRP
jgi:hypothetical protein